MRSTQFEEHSLFEEESEHRGRNRSDILCETLRRLGYARNNQVTLLTERYLTWFPTRSKSERGNRDRVRLRPDGCATR